MVGVGLRQATSHPEVLPSSTRLACYQPPGRVHLAENDIPAGDAVEVLSAAASQAGLGQREITATIRSAYRTTGSENTPGREAAPSVGPEPFVRRDRPSAGRSAQGRSLE